MNNYTKIVFFIKTLRSAFRVVKNKFSTFKWRLLGVQIPKNSMIERGVEINAPKKVVLGNNVAIRFGSIITTENPDSGYLTIEENSTINRRCIIDFTGGIKIDRNVTISNDVKINTHDHGDHPDNEPKVHHFILVKMFGLEVIALYFHKLII